MSAPPAHVHAGSRSILIFLGSPRIKRHALVQVFAPAEQARDRVRRCEGQAFERCEGIKSKRCACSSQSNFSSSLSPRFYRRHVATATTALKTRRESSDSAQLIRLGQTPRRLFSVSCTACGLAVPSPTLSASKESARRMRGNRDVAIFTWRHKLGLQRILGTSLGPP
jgi:hypothetical protein